MKSYELQQMNVAGLAEECDVEMPLTKMRMLQM